MYNFFPSKKTVHRLQYVPICWLPYVYVCSHVSPFHCCPYVWLRKMMHWLVVGEIELHVVHNV